MSTILAKNPSLSISSLNSSESEKKDADTVVREVPPPLGVSYQEKKFWFQRGVKHDSNAIATQVSLSKLNITEGTLSLYVTCISQAYLIIHSLQKSFIPAQTGKIFIGLTHYSVGKYFQSSQR
jgi:hypothetical protein